MIDHIGSRPTGNLPAAQFRRSAMVVVTMMSAPVPALVSDVFKAAVCNKIFGAGIISHRVSPS
jgi:hypothetical protein